MKFRVKPGQTLQQRDEHGSAVVRVEGDIVEGPEDWIQDFRGTLDVVGPNGESFDEVNALLVELAKSTHAHEHVGFLRAYLETNDGTDQLHAMLVAAERQAALDQAAHTARDAARQAELPVVNVTPLPVVTDTDEN